MMDAVIYARFSSSAQREASIEQQINVCMAFAEREGYNVLRTYSDKALTGRTDRRPQFLQMIKDAAQDGRFCAVIVYALDRFSRDKYDSARYKHELRANGVRVISATEPITDNPSGILIESVFEGLAQYYSAELSQKIRRGYEDNAKKCLASGSVPFGFKRSADGHYEICPEEAEIVREIFRRVDAGDTYADICRDLNARGIKTRHGAAWNRSSFNTLLSNQRYIGTYISKYHIQEDAIPQIVEKDLFYRVQTIGREKSGPRRTPNGYYALTGKLFCGLCGDAMTGTSGTARSGKLCFYYTCHGHRAHKCDQRSYPRQQLEDAICRAIWDDVLSDDAIRWMAHQTILDQDKLQADSDLDILQESLHQIEKQKQNLINAIKAGIFTASTRDELLKLEQEEADLAEKVRQAEKYLSELPTEDDIISFLELFREGYSDPDLTRSGLLDAFVTRAVVYPDHLTVFFSIKKEDRQKDIPLTDPDDDGSFSRTKWTCEDSKRTVYHISDYTFAIVIPA